MHLFLYTACSIKGLEEYYLIESDNIYDALFYLITNYKIDLVQIFKAYYGEKSCDDYMLYSKADIRKDKVGYKIDLQLNNAIGYKWYSFGEILSTINGTEISPPCFDINDNNNDQTIRIAKNNTKEYRLKMVDIHAYKLKVTEEIFNDI